MPEVDGEEWRWELDLRGWGNALVHSQMRISSHKFSACSWPGLDCEGHLLDPSSAHTLRHGLDRSLSPTCTAILHLKVIFPQHLNMFFSPLTNIGTRAESPVGLGISACLMAAAGNCSNLHPTTPSWLLICKQFTALWQCRANTTWGLLGHYEMKQNSMIWITYSQDSG